ncbi:MAG TPA: NAD(P)-dependent oxidoreductase [Phycisphaerae bacterium]|nr:NAD(P)-dependent oxidoreductase [Phycisphaerae bacterium]HOI55242.1 NAD(P)-dependent oxidoreductase [Phycisphaerae bacterium]
MRFTVLGASGFIGSHVAAHLRARGAECYMPGRDEPLADAGHLGHVLFCIGVTADFRRRPLDAVRAHVCRLLDVLEGGRFESLLYLSSSRVYAGADSGSEDATFRVSPRSLSDVYNLSKLTGEAACFATDRPTVRVARLSNVYGGNWDSENFLMAVIRQAVDAGRVVLQTDWESAKDYVGIHEVAPLLCDIAERGQARLYNVASGVRVSNRNLGDALRRVTGCDLTVATGAPHVVFPPIDTSRVKEEFGFRPASVLDAVDDLVADYRLKRKA